jgi:hypothetical protein
MKSYWRYPERPQSSRQYVQIHTGRLKTCSPPAPVRTSGNVTLIPVIICAELTGPRLRPSGTVKVIDEALESQLPIHVSK